MPHPCYVIRKKLGLSQTALAKELGHHQNLISMYEKGYKNPSLRTAYKIIAFAAKHDLKFVLEDFYQDNLID